MSGQRVTRERLRRMLTHKVAEGRPCRWRLGLAVGTRPGSFGGALVSGQRVTRERLRPMLTHKVAEGRPCRWRLGLAVAAGALLSWACRPCRDLIGRVSNVAVRPRRSGEMDTGFR